jgi:Na+-translocating ferredoxin:NAD+ oxidoreductase subunit B
MEPRLGQGARYEGVDAMEETLYRRLAEHLDRLASGFPPSETGAELRLLRRLFSPEEADLALQLALEREEARTVAERAGLPTEEAERRLDEMARKGLILSVQPKGQPTLYQAAPWVVGILEFQVNNLSEGLLQDLTEYNSTRQPPQPLVADRLRTEQGGGQVRTIPVGKSLEVRREVLAYEQIGELVDAHDRFAVAPCICRRKAKLLGGGCDAPEETCLWFGDWADYYSRTGRGRAIDRAEVIAILAQADAANLVLEPSNSQTAAFICCCCGCCCAVLKGLQQHPKPSEVVTNAFRAILDPDVCNGCMVCLDRCQMQALSPDGDRVAQNADRFIGCGLCVSTCPSGALQLVRKPGWEEIDVPADLNATWQTLSQAQVRRS